MYGGQIAVFAVQDMLFSWWELELFRVYFRFRDWGGQKRANMQRQSLFLHC